ncbi:chemotaxis protein CheW [Methanoplanus limicola]|uniref:CheW protein n=1 Tax=Methanoplanus limicola DSM 2279 TaxID=937775 RepID=H1YYQ2_9EURY|nr:chemotaxis protein CheW [Methanoplanus limicola]EHQ36035.1 CheW protein [Methanoplanus limicola DSM 2279]
MAIIDVVEYEIGGTRYALDIHLAREIVEMMPITPVPRSPDYIAGIINLRGEITNILNLNCLMGLPMQANPENQKIIVLVAEATGGTNVGIIVDNVHSVLQVPEENIEQMDNSISTEAYVKGIIKIGEDKAGEEKSLVIWTDISKILSEIVGVSDAVNKPEEDKGSITAA